MGHANPSIAGVLISLAAIGPLAAGEPTTATRKPAAASDRAARTDRTEPPIAIPTGALLQTLLARTSFSPGLIDGRAGRKTRLAIEHFQRSLDHEPTGTLNAADARALFALAGVLPVHEDPAQAASDAALDTAGWTIEYTVTEADLARITGPVPEDWNQRAELDFSGYADAEDLLAERGWCSVDLLRTLNPNVDFAAIQPGQIVRLPDVDIARDRFVAPARLEVDLENKLVRGFDDADRCVLLLHCSIAARIERAPVGEMYVKVVVTDPDYTFNPESWPEVTNVASKLRIAPGPRNPVGLAWIGLDRPGYGLHGTVRPQDIGKTGSLGCFRLTNWDAVRLAKSVAVGTPVTVLEPVTAQP